MLTQVLTIASLVTMSAALVVLALEVHRIRVSVSKLGNRPPKSSQDVGPISSPCGFAIYVFRNSRWQLESDLSAPGCEPSPPTIPGAFEGHVVKKESRPSR